MLLIIRFSSLLEIQVLLLILLEWLLHLVPTQWWLVEIFLALMVVAIVASSIRQGEVTTSGATAHVSITSVILAASAIILLWISRGTVSVCAVVVVIVVVRAIVASPSLWWLTSTVPAVATVLRVLRVVRSGVMTLMTSLTEVHWTPSITSSSMIIITTIGLHVVLIIRFVSVEPHVLIVILHEVVRLLNVPSAMKLVILHVLRRLVPATSA